MPLSPILLLIFLGQTLITDPVADFISFNPQFYGNEHELEELRVLRFDMDADGQDEVFVRSRDAHRNRQGTYWVVYTPSKDSYVRVDGFAQFWARSVYVGSFDVVEEKSGFATSKGWGIVRFWTGGSGKGTLLTPV